jgi:hypothetical protein
MGQQPEVDSESPGIMKIQNYPDVIPISPRTEATNGLQIY